MIKVCPTKKKAKILSRCQMEPFLLKNEYLNNHYTGILLAEVKRPDPHPDPRPDPQKTKVDPQH
jgi:hypothetical protein